MTMMIRQRHVDCCTPHHGNDDDNVIVGIMMTTIDADDNLIVA